MRSPASREGCGHDDCRRQVGLAMKCQSLSSQMVIVTNTTLTNELRIALVTFAAR